MAIGSALNWYSLVRIPLWGVEHYKELVVKKATDSFGGHGVSFISQQKGSIYEQLKEIDAEIAGDIVIQAPILQHPDMAKLHKESNKSILFPDKTGGCKDIFCYCAYWSWIISC